MSDKTLHSKKRFTQILGILRKHHISSGIDPIKLREILEDLGPTFVKIGQIMSTREDIFSRRYCKELMKLRDDVSPLSFETIIEVIEEEFACDYHEIFQSIDSNPLGSASIAQVHKAILLDGKDVVIKVQRPNIYEMMERDIALIRRASKILKLSNVLGNVIDINIVLDEFWYTAKEEMDFTIEANSAIKFKKTYESLKYLYTPSIYQDYSTPKVLVMEYIGGYSIDERNELINDGYDLKEIAEKLADNYISQIVDTGFFHADPHCGNLKILDGKIVWIDFGMMGLLTKKDSELLNSAVKALVLNDVTKVTDVILAIGDHGDIAYPNLYNDMEEFMNTYLNLELSKVNLGALVQDIFAICHTHKIKMPKGITMLARGMVTIESTLMLLDENISVLNIAANHVKNHQSIDLKKVSKNAGRKVIDASNSAVNIPIQLSDLLRMAMRGQFKVNLDLMDSKEPLHALDKMINRLVVVVFAAALLMGSSLICTTNMEPKLFGIPAIGFIGYVGAIIMGIYLFIKMWKIRKDGRH